MAHKWVSPKRLVRVGRDNIEPGEVFKPTDAELRSFAGKIETIDEAPESDTDEADDSGAEPTESQPDYAEMDVSELRELVKERGLADETDLRSKDAMVEALE